LKYAQKDACSNLLYASSNHFTTYTRIRLAVVIQPGTEKNSTPIECTYSLHE